MPDEYGNQNNTCAVCGDGLESYSADTPLPYSWVVSLSRLDEIDDYHLLGRPVVEVCNDCQPRIDYLIRQTAHIDYPSEMGDVVRTYASRIDGDLIIEGSEEYDD